MERDGVGVHGENNVVLQGLSRKKAWNLKEVGLGWINGGRKDHGFDGGRKEMVVNSCFQDLEGRVGLKRAWEFVPKVGKKRGMKG